MVSSTSEFESFNGYDLVKLTLGSNIASLQAQRQLLKANEGVGTVFERLSSGMRINRAADDAASLAIANTLRADSRVYNQGIRNLNDGISLLSIADSALASLTTIVERISELAEQSANGVYDYDQRRVMDDEAQALADEFQRIVASTKYNNQTLLDGSLAAMQLQAGYATLQVNVTDPATSEVALGLGTFTSTATVGVTADWSSPEVMHSGDFNGDGNTDILIGAHSSGWTRLLAGAGDGTISSNTITGSRLATIAIGDLDNDGDTDYLGMHLGSVLVFANNGTGGFSQVDTIATDFDQLDLADINNDGRLDLIGINGGVASVTYFLGNGDGTFGAGQSSAITSANVQDVKVGDLNNDGNMDLVVHGRFVPFVDVLLGNGDGTFQPKVNIDGTTNSSTLELADLNNDGNLDIIAGRPTGFAYYLGTGTGTFGGENFLAHGIDYGSESELVVADFNNDGNIDLMATGNSQNSVTMQLGNGDGTFQAASTTGVSAATHLTTGDFNGDGVPDFAIFSDVNEQVSLFVQDTITTEATNGIELAAINLRTQSSARSALETLEQELEELHGARGAIGSSLSRVSVAINHLAAAKIEFNSAEARLIDADIASESAELVRKQILQQATAAVLSQANQQPVLALKLLK